MRDSIRLGIMFNIIDADRGEKADLVPLTMDSRYRQAFARRVRQTVDISGLEFRSWFFLLDITAYLIQPVLKSLAVVSWYGFYF